MDYQYENLGDERFQEFCSVLLKATNPKIQAFPVGQPDGGRDAVLYQRIEGEMKAKVVYQVKYVRNPGSIQDQKKWILKIIEQEMEKIVRLVEKMGAEEYVLMTNVSGSSHFGGGGMDQLQVILNKIPIASRCMWREDLSRTLEAYPKVKMSFLEIVSARDLIASLFVNGGSEQQERRRIALKAYILDQYNKDKDVRFRQINLKSDLLDLFVDVPLIHKKVSTKSVVEELRFEEKFSQYSRSGRKLELGLSKKAVTAADFLLSEFARSSFPRLILEGGPGQGKSTISQYVCHVNRIRLLNIKADLEKIPAAHLKGSARFPMKIDLRDVALWVSNGVVYGEKESLVSNARNVRSLEAFLCAHFRYHSNDNSFEAQDLYSILENSYLLLIFDGFDEIADLRIREEVVDFIDKGVNKLNGFCEDLQVVVTSRPAALYSSKEFSPKKYPHFELSDLTPEIVKEFSEKWIVSNELKADDSTLIRLLVKEKLTLSHIRDLSKTPMQMSILLSLLLTRGDSLPNKRTALYDSYVELFFNRESEKNAIIRENRDVVIGIHYYVAWELHSGAELNMGDGRISETDLKRLLSEYLEREGHSVALVKDLFGVVHERVCALVSRVQGYFEFEVQPLREYFCAKYLYASTPYSPAGNEKKGTLPDRLEAIVGNPYWQNVARFFCGCFDRGEIPMLVEKLIELNEKEGLGNTNYPKLLVSQLLSDWVFAQYPKHLSSVVKIIVQGIHVGSILNQARERANNEPIRVPLECGGLEIVNECFNILLEFPPIDYALDLIAVINNNPFNVQELWRKNAIELSSIKLTKWLKYGYYLQVIHKIGSADLLSIILEDPSQVIPRIQILLDASRLEVINGDQKLKRLVVQLILRKKFVISFDRAVGYVAALAQSLDIVGLQIAASRPSFVPVSRFFFESYREYSHLIAGQEVELDEVDTLVLDFLKKIGNIDGPNPPMSTAISLWRKFISDLADSFGMTWSSFIAALILSGYKVGDEELVEVPDIYDDNIDIVYRLRFMRKKSGNTNFWRAHLVEKKSTTFILATFFAWATSSVIIELFELVDRVLGAIDDEDYDLILTAIRESSRFFKFDRKSGLRLVEYLENRDVKSDRIIYLLSLKLPSREAIEVLRKNIRKISPSTIMLYDLKLGLLLEEYLKDPNETSLLGEIGDCYAESGHVSIQSSLRMSSKFFYMLPQEMDHDVAIRILKDHQKYPRIIASIAERGYRNYLHSIARPVGEIAKAEDWFHE